MQQVDQWTFGKKVYYLHPTLGEFSSLINDDRSAVPCNWFGRLRHPEQRQDTHLILAGYAACPLRSQLSAVGRILDSLSEIKYQLRRSMIRNSARYPGIAPDFWDAELTTISNKDTDTATFGLTFEWGRPPHLRSLIVDWSSGQLFEP